MPRAIGDDRADEAGGTADKRDGRHEVEGRTMPDRLEELVSNGEARLGVEPALAVNQDVPVVVAPVARRGKKLSHCLREYVLAARRVGTRESRVAERLGRDVEKNSLVADDRVPRDSAVDAEVPLAVLRGEEEKEVAATAAEGNRFLDRDVSCVLIGLYDLRVLHRLDERQRRLLEERRIAGVDFKKDVVYAEPDFKRDDMLDHAEVVVRRARAQHKVLRARPEVCDVHRSVQLLGEVHAANPPTGLVRRREGKRLLFAALESADARDRRVTEKRLPLHGERRRAILGETRLVYRLDAEALVGRRDGRRRAEHCLSDSV